MISFKTFKVLSSRAGIGLIPVMAITSFIAMSGFLVFELVMSQKKQAAKVSLNRDFDESLKLLRFALANRKNCEFVLGGITYDPTQPKVALTSIKKRTAAGGQEDWIVTGQRPAGKNYSIESISLLQNPAIPVSGSDYATFLEIQGKDLTPGASDRKIISNLAKIPLTVRITAGKISTCISDVMEAVSNTSLPICGPNETLAIDGNTGQFVCRAAVADIPNCSAMNAPPNNDISGVWAVTSYNPYAGGGVSGVYQVPAPLPVYDATTQTYKVVFQSKDMSGAEENLQNVVELRCIRVACNPGYIQDYTSLDYSNGVTCLKNGTPDNIVDAETADGVVCNPFKKAFTAPLFSTNKTNGIKAELFYAKDLGTPWQSTIESGLTNGTIKQANPVVYLPNFNASLSTLDHFETTPTGGQTAKVLGRDSHIVVGMKIPINSKGIWLRGSGIFKLTASQPTGYYQIGFLHNNALSFKMTKKDGTPVMLLNTAARVQSKFAGQGAMNPFTAGTSNQYYFEQSAEYLFSFTYNIVQPPFVGLQMMMKYLGDGVSANETMYIRHTHYDPSDGAAMINDNWVSALSLTPAEKTKREKVCTRDKAHMGCFNYCAPTPACMPFGTCPWNVYAKHFMADYDVFPSLSDTAYYTARPELKTFAGMLKSSSYNFWLLQQDKSGPIKQCMYYMLGDPDWHSVKKYPDGYFDSYEYKQVDFNANGTIDSPRETEYIPIPRLTPQPTALYKRLIGLDPATGSPCTKGALGCDPTHWTNKDGDAATVNMSRPWTPVTTENFYLLKNGTVQEEVPPECLAAP
jgi:hypothetical protein